MKIQTLSLLLILLAVIAPNASAVISQGYTHSNDYYAVSYDEEGDAIVRAQLVINNAQTENITLISLEFPGKNIVFYEVVEEGSGASGCRKSHIEKVCTSQDEFFNCIKYEEQEKCDYWDENPWAFKTITDLVEEKTSTSTLLHMTLPFPIKPNEQSTITLFYKIPRSSSSFLGAHSFNFKTVIDSKAKLIENVRVAVNVQPGLSLKGTGSSVNYQPDFFSSQSLESMKVASLDENSYRSYTSRISYAQGYVKTASNLDPWESFSVKGKYSKSWIRLYVWNILLFLLIFSLVGIGLTKLVRKKISSIKKSEKTKGNHSVFISILAGFFSSFAIVLFWFAMRFLFDLISRWMYYGTSNMLMPLLALLAILLFLALLFGPSIYIGVRYGALTGLLTFAFTILWLFIILIALAIILIMFSYHQYPIYKVMEDVARI